MAVQPQTPYKEYTANGSTKSFALEFDCDNQDHLIVLVDDVEAIVGTWSLSNDAVVFNTAPENGKKITIQRNTPFRRDGDFQSYDNSFRPGPVNKGFDWIWLKLQELGVADWILNTRINDLRAYVDKQDIVLQDNIDSLKNYVDDKDDELRNYLLNAIQEQGVALDQLEEYYSYLMQQLAQVAIDRGWAASFIVSADGSTQQEINDFGGAKWWDKPLGYGIGATVKLDNGDIVKSTIDGNENDPNVDMTGWEYNETKFISNISELPPIKKYDGARVFDTQTQTYLVYDSAKSNINDGVITFDGWVRQIENNTLLAIYAGVTEGLTSSQYTARLQALLSAAKDNYIIDFQFIPATVDTHLFISGKSGVVVESPNLTAAPNFAFSGSSRGILRPSNCYGIIIQNHYVKGAKKTNPNVAMATTLGASGRFQDGDAGIELINCDESHVRHGTVHHCKTWGILRIDCSGGSTHDNTVYDCVRQSGISPALGNGKVIKKPKVYRNTVSMCGLYGLEIENLSGSVEEPSVFDNTVSYCQGGLMLVNAVSGLDANNNKISNCYYGLAGVGVNPSATAEGKLRNFYKNNTLTGNYMALAPSNSKYLSFIGNPISGIITDEWLIQSPYDTVEKVASANSFYCLQNLTVGLQIKVNDAVYEVASSTAVTTTTIVEEIGLSTVYLIALTANMIGVSDLTQFKRKITQTFGYNAFFQANTSIRVMRNIISDCTNAVNQTAVQADNADNMVSDNTFNKCTNVYTGNATGYRSKQSTFNDCTGVLTLQKVNSGNNALRNLEKVQQGAVLNAVSPKPTQTFYSYSEQHLVRLRVVAKNVTWTSNSSNPISLVVRVNGNQVGAAISVSTQNSNVDTLLSAASSKLLDGANTVQIIDTSASLGCDSWSVDVFVVD